MSWFKRKVKGILTPTSQKREMPEGLWYKTEKGDFILAKELEENCYVSKVNSFHVRIGSKEYFQIIFDNNSFEELDADLGSTDFLNFTDTKSYKLRLEESAKETKLNEAIRCATGKMNDIEIVVACMDFQFIGGSMGVVVGKKIANAVDRAIQLRSPLLIISKSGGARMMEGAFALMQMAKTSAKLLELSRHRLPYISLLTHPTTGGVSASYAMLGDFNIAEPGALIGFAGPRVIKELTRRDLPKGFQTSEFLLEKGFLDFIVDRRELKATLTRLLRLLS